MNLKMLVSGTIVIAISIANMPAYAVEAATHTGKLISLTKEKVVMTSRGGKDGKERTFPLAPNAQFTLDGKPCKADDLKSGTKIRLTMQIDDPKTATQVEAIVKNEMFSNMAAGKIVSIDAENLMLENRDGQKRMYSLTADTKIACDGLQCKFSDLKTGQRIRLTTMKSDTASVTEIEALDANREFEAP